MKELKTAKQMDAESKQAAKNLPTETKRTFWHAMMKEGKNLGEAKKIAGISDLMVAAQLAILCHNKIYVPMGVDKIH